MEARRRSFITRMPAPAAVDQPSTCEAQAKEGAGGAVILNHQDIDIFTRLDVGKSGHHAVAVERAGKKLFDKALPIDEARLREILASLSRHGRILLVADQLASIDALPVVVAQPAGAAVGYPPGLAMHRIADLHPGQAKIDARDAAIIAEAARSMPHTLRTIARAARQSGRFDGAPALSEGQQHSIEDPVVGQVENGGGSIRRRHSRLNQGSWFLFRLNA